MVYVAVLGKQIDDSYTPVYQVCQVYQFINIG